MLKRLELIGFKSFAEKTRFDFARGITAIVGPNGSGKSNVVDAVKWILGEQSAKSLRGGEMADVIFNGSSTRKSLGLAEVTMTFDNAKRVLQYDGDEVQITRRVYRDGQGEYLINGQLSRLRDIKEMFLGSGAGHGAYSIIEQGRVDALLTASTKDRRQIFEEAAGISRFKSKKTEALRKLEATELNLNRVKDILQELEKSLKTLNSQAVKARKYQEFQEQLKQLRVGLGLREFRDMAETLAYQEDLLGRLKAELGDATTKIEQGEAAGTKLDEEVANADDDLRRTEKQLGEARQQIAEHDAAASSRREQAAGFEAESLRIGQQRGELHRRLAVLTGELTKASDEADAADREAAAEQHRADAAAAALNVVTATIVELARQAQVARDEQFALVGRAAQLTSAAEMASAQVERLRKEVVRKKAEGEKAAAEAEAIGRVLSDLSQNNADLQTKLSEAAAELADLQQRQADLRHQAESLQPRLDELRDHRGDLRGRADVLEQLERSQEGLGAGVRTLLDSKPNEAILGLVADLLTVPSEYAPLIDLALGDAAQRFVVRDAQALTEVLDSLGDLPGRVGFVPLASGSRQPPDSNFQRVENQGADVRRSPLQFVASTCPGLVEQLLGNVWIVNSLDEARSLHRSQSNLRIITRTGEVLEPDGTVIVGPPGTGAGILSRKSELRDLRQELTSLDADVAALKSEQSAFRQQAEGLEAPISGRGAGIAALTAKAGDVRDALAAQREKQARLTDLIALVGNETTILAAELANANEAFEKTSLEAAGAEQAAAVMKATLVDTESQLRLAEVSRETRQQENTAAQVALSRAKQQAAALRQRVQELDAERLERTADGKALADRAAETAQKHDESHLAALRAATASATAHSQKELHERAVAALTQRRGELRSERDRVQDELRLIRDVWKERQDQAHAHELTLRDLVNRRESIVGRIREDYSLELSELDAEQFQIAAEVSDDEAQEQIDDLKKKIARLGSVNLEALEQLAAEEAREKSLRAEFDDLTAAQKSLLEIIETINVDSRRLFVEMLATVRLHFQELFRKLFGGGMADIILEDPTDVLESGIEITARPPGKELRSISLLSGGEKTLTAVAMLLAIFRSRPSPFCLLDEVDAALDEANTLRFGVVLREFLDQSQFIIITHKKRTMAMADVLYGITMQESGVSKQVATRIEDWPDEEPQVNAA